jgi:hypothetical protein
LKAARTGTQSGVSDIDYSRQTYQLFQLVERSRSKVPMICFGGQLLFFWATQRPRTDSGPACEPAARHSRL